MQKDVIREIQNRLQKEFGEQDLKRSSIYLEQITKFAYI